MAEIVVKLVSEKHHLVLHPLAGTKTISSLNPKNHHRHNSGIESMFWHVNNDFFDYNIKAGVKTKSKAIGVYDVAAEQDVSLKDVFEFLPGDLSRKILSQGQILKVCKHFKEWLKPDDYTLFLCKINEETSFDFENPWSNLMVVEIELDHEGDLGARLISKEVIAQKCFLKKEYRIIIPKRTKLIK